MVNWCGCYEMLLLMIHAMGIHNYGVVVWIELFLKVLWKLGELMICDRMMFSFQVLYGFDCFGYSGSGPSFLKCFFQHF